MKFVIKDIDLLIKTLVEIREVYGSLYYRGSIEIVQKRDEKDNKIVKDVFLQLLNDA